MSRIVENIFSINMILWLKINYQIEKPFEKILFQCWDIENQKLSKYVCHMIHDIDYGSNNLQNILLNLRNIE